MTSSGAAISVVILTLNEELNLPGALDSLKGHCEDVVVFDSFSADRTVEIAARWGARVVQRTFTNYAEQRNASLQVGFVNRWVLILDADERITAPLWNEMLAAIQVCDASVSMFRMRRKDVFLGKWLRRSSGYPTWFGRLVVPGHVTVAREINEEYLARGDVAYLKEHLWHYPFNRGVAHWVDRHNAYSSLEARRVLVERRASIGMRSILRRDPVARRKALKQLAFRVPMRPFATFLYLYVVRFGCFDGLAGLYFCLLRAGYELLIDLKVREIDSEGTSDGQ